jgi:hypothetical protein
MLQAYMSQSKQSLYFNLVLTNIKSTELTDNHSLHCNVFTDDTLLLMIRALLIRLGSKYSFTVLYVFKRISY